MKITNFKQLNSWQQSHFLVLTIYKISSTFPKQEQFGLTNQIRRAAVSITSNIAEGFGRIGKKEKQHFFQIALGSLNEVESQLEIAKDLRYINSKTYQQTLVHVQTSSKLLSGLIRSTKQNYKLPATSY